MSIAKKRKRSTFLFLALLGGYLISTALLSCGGLKDLLSPQDDDQSSIPEDVLDLAGGIFDIIGRVVEDFDAIHDDPNVLSDIPGGISVDVTTPDDIKLTFTGYNPNPGDSVSVNGTIAITKLGSTPFKVEIKCDLTLTGHTYSKVTITGTAEWAAGSSPQENEPETVTGTFTVDGKSYNLDEVLKALAERDEDGGGGGSRVPAPAELRGKSYYLIATRALASGWVAYTGPSKKKLDINSEGTGWGLEGGTVAGLIHWDNSTLYLQSSDGTQNLYGLHVFSYSETELYCFNSVWDDPNQAKDLYFNVDEGYSVGNISY